MSGVRAYLNFCQSLQVIPFPVTEDLLCFFAVFSFNRGISFKTIKVYIQGTLNQNTMLGHQAQLSSMPVLHRVVRGIRRRQGNSCLRRQRKPITVNHLRLISACLNSGCLPLPDKYMYLTACLVAFFGLMRVSEFTSPTQVKHDIAIHLLREDVSFNTDFSILSLRIKASKTDPFRAGTTIRIAASFDSLCPVGAIRNYLELTQHYDPKGPLFRLTEGKFLTRRLFIIFLQNALPLVRDINTHSFRIGGASAALSAGAPDSMIRILGRWSSDCYLRYLRIADKDIAQFQLKMAKIPMVSSIWDPDKW